jgi:hypothetical protein
METLKILPKEHPVRGYPQVKEQARSALVWHLSSRSTVPGVDYASCSICITGLLENGALVLTAAHNQPRQVRKAN